MHSIVDGYLDCVHLGAIINEVAMTLIAMSLGEHMSSCWLYTYEYLVLIDSTKEFSKMIGVIAHPHQHLALSV